MAAVTYHCPVDDSCQEAGQPGFCVNHPDTRLERVRPRLLPPQVMPRGPAEPEAEEPTPYTPVPLVAVRYLGNSVQVPGTGLVVGRDGTPTLELPGGVSRAHAHLHWDGPVLQVTDLYSTNHTFIDDRQLEPGAAAMVKPGQTMRLGEDVELAVVELEVDDLGRPL